MYSKSNFFMYIKINLLPSAGNILLQNSKKIPFFSHPADSAALSAKLMNAAIHDAYLISRREKPIHWNNYCKKGTYLDMFNEELTNYGIKYQPAADTTKSDNACMDSSKKI